MKNILMLIGICASLGCAAQIDKDQLALSVNKADEANTEKLKSYIWKRKSDVSVNGEVKLTTITEFSFNEKGELEAKIIDAESSVQQKRGVRGRVQENAIEDKAAYVKNALELSMAYTFMTKGQLMDFFSKATVTEKDGVLEAKGADVYVKGDKLTIWIDKATMLYTKKQFSSLQGKDPIDGEINYEKFSSGVNHSSNTVLNMPIQKMKIDAKNQDYTQRVK